MVPLSQHALTNLCQEGFGTAIYLYETGYSTSNASVRCKPLSGVSNSAGNGNELAYVDKPISNSKIANLNLNDILRLIHQRIVSPNDHRPVYMHCWNGWHASGYASAIVLRQFCGWSGAQALEYWKCATDRNDYGYSQLRDDILNFKPMSSLKITGSVSREICPTISTSECPGIKQ